MNPASEPRTRVGIIGGGPGGLMTAYLLQHAYRAPVEITLFEASDRLGGKVRTQRFPESGALYEVGAAELYDYSEAGPDPLRELIESMGLSTTPMEGRAVFIGDQLLHDAEDLVKEYGPNSLAAYRAFVQKARSLISPAEYYESDWQQNNDDPLVRQSFAQLLKTIEDDAVRRYVAVSVHSDVAAEPDDCSAMYGLHNFLMNEPGYMKLYCIDGGLERLTAALTQRIDVDVRLNHRVDRVESRDDGSFRVATRHDGQTFEQEFDAVVIALPNYWIPAIEFAGPGLAAAMAEHHAHYDYPAHYLRISIRFREPFWRRVVRGSYFMLDAFGGCCVYDESSREPSGDWAVLGWLLGGDAALTLSNLDDSALIQRALDSLPAPLREGRGCWIEGKVHRWVGSVNARPGGFPMRDPDSRHVPDPVGNPMLFVVGDYLFDSTLNGALDSAGTVACWISEEVADDPVAAIVDATPQHVEMSVESGSDLGTQHD
jgi:monoamine oxidase